MQNAAHARMTADRVYQLGLFVRRTASGMEADLSLESAQLANPLSGRSMDQASFRVVGERLVALEPPELVGLPPISLAEFDTAGQLRNFVVADFRRLCAQLDRRTAQLAALGIPSTTDPETLHLTAEVIDGDVLFELSSDKRGNFRLARARRGRVDLNVSGTQAFELSEFQDRETLCSHLRTLLPAATPARAADGHTVSLQEAAQLFGAHAVLPPAAQLELLVEFQVSGRTYRFAAARVKGRTFRGLLAGPEGKLWADHFELGRFEGVAAVAAKVLNVPEDAIAFSPAEEA